MFSVQQASEIVFQNAQPLPARTCQLVDALGLVLAEDVASDLDMPPYDKSLMDGFAVRAADVAGGKARLSIVEEVMAGQVPRRAVAAGQATHLMTGAPLPE